jgi:hypothetical protein
MINSVTAKTSYSLHAAIKLTQGGTQITSMVTNLPPASQDQVEDLVRWYADTMVERLWALPHVMAEHTDLILDAKKDAANTYKTAFAVGIAERTNRFMSVLTNADLYSVNAMDLEGAQAQVKKLAKMDRLPKYERLEGLILIRQAWDEYDVTMYMADRYKRLSKFLYFLFLVLGLTMVILSSCNIKLLLAKESNYAVQILGLATSVLVSVISYLNPSQRWRHLRSCACKIRSEIWKYRTRIGNFSHIGDMYHSTEEAFFLFLSEWREELISGSDLLTTGVCI